MVREAARMKTKMNVANIEMSMATVMNRTIVVVQGSPNVVTPIPDRRHMGRRPTRLVEPDPSMVRVMLPTAIVRRVVFERIVTNPDAAIGRHMAPVPEAIRHIIVNHGRTPCPASVNVGVVSKMVEVTVAYVVGKVGGGLAAPLIPHGQQFRPLTAPFVEGIHLVHFKPNGGRG